MAARFHANSIDLIELKLRGYHTLLINGGEVMAISSDAARHERGDAEFERVLSGCLLPRAVPSAPFTAHELACLAEQGMSLTDDEHRTIATATGA